MTGETTLTSEQVRKAHEELAKALEAEAKAKSASPDTRNTYIFEILCGDKIVSREIRGFKTCFEGELAGHATWNVFDDKDTILATFNFECVLGWHIKGAV